MSNVELNIFFENCMTWQLKIFSELLLVGEMSSLI